MSPFFLKHFIQRKTLLFWTIFTSIILFYTVSIFLPPKRDQIDFRTIGALPVLDQGRVKALDTVARSYLVQIQGSQSYKNYSQKDHKALQWFLDYISSPETSASYPLVLVEHPQLFAIFGDQYYKQKYRVSFDFLDKNQQHFLPLASLADRLESPERNTFQKAVIAVRNRWFTLKQLQQSFLVLKPFSSFGEQETRFFELNGIGQELVKNNINDPRLQEFTPFFKAFQQANTLSLIAPILTQQSNASSQAFKWTSYADGYLQTLIPNPFIEYQLKNYSLLLDSYKQKNNLNLSKSATNLKQFYLKHQKSVYTKTQLEYWFNQANMFYSAAVLYIFSLFVLSLSGFMLLGKPLSSLIMPLASAGFFIHSAGLLFRMLIEGRPPVTNLYSSAVFVGWAAVGMGLFLERLFKNRLGLICAALSGILSLIVAHHLALSGDTMEMMRAVLDSNFWLATHVITITLGYSAVFIAGFLGIVYLTMGSCTSLLNKKLAKQIVNASYGMMCVALLFSVIGTVLGGIWADQSWGRFWGWDPKENGAILIVLWLAISLHAKLAGQVKQTGLMVMAVFGNIVCSASWFGVNMLGIGLHSYGFMDKAFIWLIAFWASQILFMLIGLIPKKYWLSN